MSSIHNTAPAKRFDTSQRPACSCCKRPKISTIMRLHPIFNERFKLCIECYGELMTQARLKKYGQRTIVDRAIEIQKQTQVLESLNLGALMPEKA